MNTNHVMELIKRLRGSLPDATQLIDLCQNLNNTVETCDRGLDIPSSEIGEARDVASTYSHVRIMKHYINAIRIELDKMEERMDESSSLTSRLIAAVEGEGEDIDEEF